MNLLSLVFMLAYLFFMMPAIWVFAYRGNNTVFIRATSIWGFKTCGGLRRGVIVGAVANGLGALLRWIAVCDWLKVSENDRFVITFLGQTLAAIGQVFILGVPPDLASSWFGASERNTASAIAIAANNLGIALGFLASMGIDDDRLQQTIEPYFLIQWLVSLCAAVLILLFFKNNPMTAPSRSTEREDDMNKSRSETDELSPLMERELRLTTFEKLKDLCRNRVFVCLCISFGLINAVSYALSSVIAEVMVPAFPAYQDNIGILGFIVVVGGTMGALVCGYVLDRTMAYRSTYLWSFAISFLGALGFHLVVTFAPLSEPATYYSACMLIIICSISGLATVPIAYQYASELFYPHSDAMITGMLNNVANTSGAILIVVMSLLDNHDGEPVPDTKPGAYTMSSAMLSLLLTIAVSFAFAFGVKGDLHRSTHDRRQSVYVRNSSSSTVVIE